MKIVEGWAFPDADEFMVSELNYQDGTYQRSHLDAALRHVKNFSGALDGGAHIGTWSRILNDRFSSVLAVEPSPDTFECLDHNMKAHGCKNVVTVNIALGDTPGFISMTMDEKCERLKNTGGRHIKRSGGDVPLVRIDDLDLADLGFLKLDIEGSEPSALRGARETLKRFKPIVLFEDKKLWVKHFGEPKDACESVLKELGAHFIEKAGCDQIWGW